MLDNGIHWKKHYPVGTYLRRQLHYPLDRHYFYPGDSVIQVLNNWGQMLLIYMCALLSQNIHTCSFLSPILTNFNIITWKHFPIQFMLQIKCLLYFFMACCETYQQIYCTARLHVVWYISWALWNVGHNFSVQRKSVM